MMQQARNIYSAGLLNGCILLLRLNLVVDRRTGWLSCRSAVCCQRSCSWCFRGLWTHGEVNYTLLSRLRLLQIKQQESSNTIAHTNTGEPIARIVVQLKIVTSNIEMMLFYYATLFSLHLLYSSLKKFNAC